MGAGAKPKVLAGRNYFTDPPKGVEMTDHAVETSPQVYAQLCGVLYLACHRCCGAAVSSAM
jgi:hypothetical protein